VSVVAAWRFAELSVSRHQAFHSNAYDLGFFDQIIWNTSEGRLFENSFVPYNFLGQHFEPVLLVFAGVYRFGGDVAALLIAQAAVVALAALPLYYATRNASGSAVAGMAIATAFLLNPSLHEAVNHDFHPELLGFTFLFLALYFLVDEKPRSAAIAVLPLLLLKEEMALLLLAFACLMFVRGYGKEGLALTAVGLAWAVFVAGAAMTLIRGGSSDLTRRYDHLLSDSSGLDGLVAVLPRALSHLFRGALDGFVSLLAEMGFVALLNPLGTLVALAAAVPAGLSDHPWQAGLGLHYVMPSLALLWVAVVLALRRISRARIVDGPLLGRSAGLVVLAASLISFLTSSPYAPGKPQPALSAPHAAALGRALALIPSDAALSAQSSVLPHVARRRHVYEFPRLVDAEYVVVDSGLPRSSQSLADGLEAKLEQLPQLGYREIFAEQGVRVFAR
jgi:uncharacterized membrane protein